MRTGPSTPTRETKYEGMDKVVTPDLKQEHDAQVASPYFPAHPFRNPRHARRISTVNAPHQIQLFGLHSDP